jgi:hypothetical protein
MRRRMFVSFGLVAVALCALGAENSCKAPMDATGDYSGTWSINVKEKEIIVDTMECGPIRMTLEQDVTLEPLDNLKVTGVLCIDDYSCLEEAGWPDCLVPDPQEVDIAGTMGTQDGKLILASGGLGTGVGAIFIMDGNTESDEPKGNEIPEMTAYSGNWGLAVSVVFIGTAGVDGTFEVNRD